MLPGMFVIFSVTLVVWTLAFLYFRNFLRRRTGSRRILEEFQEEVDKIIAEIDSATDRGLTLMDDRIASLKNLLEETDRRISVYKKESERKTMHEHAYAELGKKVFVKSEDKISSIFDSENVSGFSESTRNREKQETSFFDTSVYQSSEKSESDAQLHSDAQLSNEVPRFIRSSIRVEAKTPFAEQVMQLSQAGFSNELIAKKLGAAIAEVELVMNLAERKLNP
jgi:hypothetical protein